MNDRFSKFWSIDEMKGSILVLVLIGLVGVGSYIAVKHGDMPQNVSNIIETLVLTIGGVNALNLASNNFANRNTSQSTYTNQNLTTMQTIQQVTPIVDSNLVVDMNTNPLNTGDNTDPSTRPI